MENIAFVWYTQEFVAVSEQLFYPSGGSGLPQLLKKLLDASQDYKIDPQRCKVDIP